MDNNNITDYTLPKKFWLAKVSVLDLGVFVHDMSYCDGVSHFLQVPTFGKIVGFR